MPSANKPVAVGVLVILLSTPPASMTSPVWRAGGAGSVAPRTCGTCLKAKLGATTFNGFAKLSAWPSVGASGVSPRLKSTLVLIPGLGADSPPSAPVTRSAAPSCRLPLSRTLLSPKREFCKLLSKLLLEALAPLGAALS